MSITWLAFGAQRKRAHVIVIGNEKGGSGKSTTAMNLIVALLRAGRTVACIDLDVRQGSLSRYLDNRRTYAACHGVVLPVPHHDVIYPSAEADLAAARAEESRRLDALMTTLSQSFEVIIIDMPGYDTYLSRLGHGYANTLITPLNDSFMDLDVLAEIAGQTMKITGPSHYARMVLKQQNQRTAGGIPLMDWIVMRNRLSSLDSHSKRAMAFLLRGLSEQLGFRTVAGFGERVIFRELFLKGLTLMDLRDAPGRRGLSVSHIAARQEVRTLIEAIRLPPPRVPELGAAWETPGTPFKETGTAAP